MKKFKEFLLMFVPFILLSVLSAAYFVLNISSNSFMGRIQYLKLLISDPFFIIALVNTFVPAIILSAMIAILYMVLTRKKKQIIGRRNYYLFLFLLSLVAPIVYVVILTRTFDIVNNTIYTLQTGIIVTFICWMFETIINAIKSKKS